MKCQPVDCELNYNITLGRRAASLVSPTRICDVTATHYHKRKQRPQIGVGGVFGGRGGGGGGGGVNDYRWNSD